MTIIEKLNKAFNSETFEHTEIFMHENTKIIYDAECIPLGIENHSYKDISIIVNNEIPEGGLGFSSIPKC